MKNTRQRGATLVEMALVMSLLFMLVFGIMEFGRLFNVYHTMTNAAREGARFGAAPCPYLSLSCSPAGGLVSVSAIQNRVQTYLSADGVQVNTSNISVHQSVSVSDNGIPENYTQETNNQPNHIIVIPYAPTLTVSAEMRNENN